MNLTASTSKLTTARLLYLSAASVDVARWQDAQRWNTIPCTDPSEVPALLRDGEFDAVLVCLPIEGWPAEEILEECHRNCPHAPVVVLDVERSGLPLSTARMIRLGAFHYLSADAAESDVLGCIAAALDHRRSLVAVEPAAEPWRRLLVGESAAMRNVADIVRLVAARRSTVLISGETGTGKEMAARAIHLAGDRAGQPMVAVNCSALPEHLLEAELFGHVRGAFTGAINHRVGRFEQAHRGTLFLDEIGDMPMELQVKLLRVLQEREFQRLGSSETVKIDARVIAASNVNLGERVREGKFREDLYYRINVVPIHMPALHERRSDIPLLVQHFLDKICRQEQIALKQVTPETLESLCRHAWPGNVRQLENSIEMAVALSGERRWLYPVDFRLPSAAARPAMEGRPARIALPEHGIDFAEVVGGLERDLLEQAMHRTGGNKKLAADLLRLKRTTLAAKLKSFESLAAFCEG